MQEHPIIFSSEMVRVILGGRKTQTRRVIKARNVFRCYLADKWHVNKNPISGWQVFPYPNIPQEELDKLNQSAIRNNLPGFKCPYGQVGDRLWVKEAWRVGAWAEDSGQLALDYMADGYCRREWITVADEDLFNRLWEQSTMEAQKRFGIQERYAWKPGESPCHWRSSIFMPRWASRITLEITDVRIERLQDISEDDAEAEGAHGYTNAASPIDFFICLWNSLNTKRNFGWDMNPWVWVISFKRIEQRR